MHRNARIAAASLAIALIAACSPPKPPEEERRPQPQAENTQAQSAIVQAADAYKDRARDAVKASQDAAERERAQLDAATQ